MGKVLILQNAPLFTGGTFESELDRRKIPFEYHKVFEAGAPSVERSASCTGVVVLGGPLKFQVAEAEKKPELARQISFLRACLDRHLPILAVSQGAILLAQAQGAWVEKAPRKEIGWVQAEVYPDYSRNSVIFSKVEEKKFPVFAWYDTFHGFPPRGYWYLTTPHCRYLASGIHGNCYLFNFHPEITEELLQAWLKEYGKELDSKEEGGKMLAQAQENLTASKGFSRKIIHAFESFLK